MKNKGLVGALAVILVFAFTAGVFGDSSVTRASGKEKGPKKGEKKGEAGTPESVEEAFRKAFPKTKVDTIKPTEMKGIYEVTAGVSIAYFVPDGGYLILGDVINSKGGVNITAQRREKLVAVRNQSILAKAKDLPLDKALKIGEGKTTVIEFTDPDCPYCRTASEFFSKKKGLTRYIFFMPLPGHPDAENKVKYVLCAPDKSAAYEEAMTGKLDNKKYEVCKDPEVDALVVAQKDTAIKTGIQSTPFFIIDGTAVSGANIQALEEALKKDVKAEKQAPGANSQ